MQSACYNSGNKIAEGSKVFLLIYLKSSNFIMRLQNRDAFLELFLIVQQFNDNYMKIKRKIISLEIQTMCKKIRSRAHC